MPTVRGGRRSSFFREMCLLLGVRSVCAARPRASSARARECWDAGSVVGVRACSRLVSRCGSAGMQRAPFAFRADGRLRTGGSRRLSARVLYPSWLAVALICACLVAATLAMDLSDGVPATLSKCHRPKGRGVLVASSIGVAPTHSDFRATADARHPLLLDFSIERRLTQSRKRARCRAFPG